MFKGKSRLTENLVALKEIRLEHEEGAPCTAIREGEFIFLKTNSNWLVLFYTKEISCIIIDLFCRSDRGYLYISTHIFHST